MNTLLYELPVSEKTLLSLQINIDKFWADYEKSAHLKLLTDIHNDKTEFTEIDPFTGQVRIIRR